jgi:transcription-repair coupling factor (superfamily II helicase)
MPKRDASSILPAPPLPKPTQPRLAWRAPPGSSLALWLARAAEAHDGLVLAVVRDTHAAHALEAELAVFAGDRLPVLHFPDWETLPYDLFAPHPDIVSQRMATLFRLPAISRGLLVVPVATLMQRLPPRAFVAAPR